MVSNAAWSRCQNGTGALRPLLLQYLVAIRNDYPPRAMMLSAGWGPCTESQQSASQMGKISALHQNNSNYFAVLASHRASTEIGMVRGLATPSAWVQPRAGLPGRGAAQPSSWVPRSCASSLVQNTAWRRDGRDTLRSWLGSLFHFPEGSIVFSYL